MEARHQGRFCQLLTGKSKEYSEEEKSPSGKRKAPERAGRLDGILGALKLAPLCKTLIVNENCNSFER